MEDATPLIHEPDASARAGWRVPYLHVNALMPAVVVGVALGVFHSALLALFTFHGLCLVAMPALYIAALPRDAHGATGAQAYDALVRRLLADERGERAAYAALAFVTMAAVGFVGSSDIAQYIYAEAAKTGKRAQCFGGAKNHAIIMPDADMDQTVDALIGAGYGSAGERCMAISAAVPVGEATADRLMEKMIPRVEALKIGPSTDMAADYGPLVTAAAVKRVRGLIDKGVEEGAKLAVDGRDFKMQGYENGFYLGGSLFDNVTKDMRIYKEEIFGPVLSVVRAKDYHEALALPSDHDYGNGVAIFTRDGDAARDFVSRVQVGMVGVNVPIPVPVAYHTFGGWKRSAFGDTNQHGPEGVKFFTKIKTVTQRWPTGEVADQAFVIPTMQ